jgi:hypothetical protein
MDEIDIIHFFPALQKTDLQKGEPSDYGECTWSLLDEWESFLPHNFEHQLYVPYCKLGSFIGSKNYPSAAGTQRRHSSRLSLILLTKVTCCGGWML